MKLRTIAGKVKRRARGVPARLKAQAIARTAVARDYTFLDPLDLPAIDRDTLLNGGRTGIWYENGTENRVFERLRPSFVDDPDNVRIFSEEYVQNASLTYPPGFALSGRDVTLTGYRSFLTHDTRFFTDDAMLSDRRTNWFEHYRHMSPVCEGTGFEPLECRDMFRLRRSRLEAEHIPGRVVALVQQEPLIYGSWLFRAVTKLTSLERLGLKDERVMAHLLYPSYREALVLGGLKADKLIHQDTRRMYRFDHVIVPCNRNGHAFLDNESLAVFKSLREKSGYKHDGRKIYVARNKPGEPNSWNGRVMLNEAELIERLIPLGFEIVVPHRLPLPEQIRIFASAGFVLGASGSAMFNAMFCQPGTKLIDIESEPHWINAHMCLFSSLGLDYGIFVGKVDPADTADVHRKWRVNVDPLIERVTSFMR